MTPSPCLLQTSSSSDLLLCPYPPKYLNRPFGRGALGLSLSADDSLDIPHIGLNRTCLISPTAIFRRINRLSRSRSLNASKRAVTIMATDVGPARGLEIVLFFFYVDVGLRREVWNIPAIASICLMVRFVASPLHSRTFMPNSDVKKERGRKL